MSQLCFSSGRCEDRHFLRGRGLLSVLKPGLCSLLREWVGSPQIPGGGFLGRWGSAPASTFESQVCVCTPPAAAAAPQGRAALAAWFSYISRMLCWACHPGEGAMVHKITHVVSFCSNLGAAESPTIAAAILLCSCLATVRVRECVRAPACQQLTPCRWVLMPEEVSCEAREAEWAQLAGVGAAHSLGSAVALPRVCGCGLQTSSLVKCRSSWSLRYTGTTLSSLPNLSRWGGRAPRPQVAGDHAGLLEEPAATVLFKRSITDYRGRFGF